MMKRVLAFILSIVFLLSAFGISTFANVRGYREELRLEESEWITSDQLTILNKLGISPWATVSDMGERVMEIVSRWMVADYISGITKAKDGNPETFETLFRDLTSEHKYYAQIKGVVKSGYMQGDPDGYFRPNEAITAKEAAIVLLRVLGYAPYMKIVGENKVFNMTKVLEGIPLEDKLTQAQFLRMIYNMLDSPAVNSSTYTAVNAGESFDINYIVNDNYLGFEHLYGIYHKEGVVDAVKGTTLTKGGNILKDDVICINGKNYVCSNDVARLLGYKVEYFYRAEQSGKCSILHLFKSNKNNTLVLSHDMIDRFASGVYTYLEGNNERKVTLSPLVSIIYNGVADPSCEESEMVPDFGWVTFIDNDGHSGYEVVSIENFEFYCISEVNVTDKKVYDRSKNTVKVLDLDGLDELEMINENNKTVEINGLRQNNMMAVMQSTARSGYKKAYAQVVKVTEKNVKATVIGKDYIKFPESEYVLWEGIKGSVAIDKIYNVYTFCDVAVMMVEAENQGSEYAYLIKADEDSDAFETGIKFLIMDNDLNMSVFEAAKRVEIDGQIYTTFNSIETLLKSSAIMYSNGYNAEYPLAQPIKVAFNTAGKVVKIDTMQYNPDKEDENTLQFATDAFGKKARFDKHNNSFYTLSDGSTDKYKHLVASCNTGQTVLMNIPLNRMDAMNYTSSKGAASDGGIYNIDIIGRDKNSSVADMIIIYTSDRVPTINNAIRPYVIYDLSEEVNEDGDVECLVRAYYIAQKKEFTCDRELYETLSIGDVYTFAVDKKNHIQANYKVYSVNDPFPSQPYVRASTNYSLSYGIASYFGTLVHTDGNFLKVCQSLTTDPGGLDITKGVDNYLVDSTIGIYKYTNIREPKVEEASLGDAIAYTTDPEKASKVMVTVYYGLDTVYIVEN